jgi:hypothetical protein
MHRLRRQTASASRRYGRVTKQYTGASARWMTIPRFTNHERREDAMSFDKLRQE